MSNTDQLEVKFGLPREVKFCKKCVMSNQRPASEVEFKHNINTKKRHLILMKKAFVMHVGMRK